MGRISKNQWPNDGRVETFVAQVWMPKCGDRRQELVFAGIGMKETGIRERLDPRLLSDKKFEPEFWQVLPDPFSICRPETETIGDA